MVVPKDRLWVHGLASGSCIVVFCGRCESQEFLQLHNVLHHRFLWEEVGILSCAGNIQYSGVPIT